MQILKSQAAKYIKSRTKDYFKRDKSGKGFICPFCDSGNGPNGTGMTVKNGRFTCWAHKSNDCPQNNDLIDIIGKLHGIDYPSPGERSGATFWRRVEFCAHDLGFELIDDDAAREREELKKWIAPLLENYDRKKAAAAGQPTPDNGQPVATGQPSPDTTNAGRPVVKHADDVAPTSDKQSTDGQFSELFATARKNIRSADALDFLKRRGFLTHDGAPIFDDRYNLGFLAQWKANEKATFSPRLIIPRDGGGYLARDTRPNIDGRGSKIAQGRQGFFNSSVLWTSETPVFVVEGELDALSLIDTGTPSAVAVGSVENSKAFLRMVIDRPPVQPLIIAFDNDDAGKSHGRELLSELMKNKIPAISANLYAPNFKDANERLQTDRNGLTFAAMNAESVAKNTFAELPPVKEKAPAPDTLPEVSDNLTTDNLPPTADSTQPTPEELQAEQERAEYLATSDRNFSDRFRHPEKLEFEQISTGFEKLDELLNGGLRAGVYVLGAITSLGKSTFCLQLAGQIAKAGHDVLYFSLEMSRDELMAKTYSRLSYEKARHRDGDAGAIKSADFALNAIQISNPDGRARLTAEQNEFLFSVFDEYDEFSGNMYTVERGTKAQFTVLDVCEIISKHVRLTGRKPVVVVDYLQYLSPAAPNMNPRQATDHSMQTLKALSLTAKIPIVAISSFNRENYFLPVSVVSFKESGGVEYSSDVLMGLQFHGMDYSGDDTSESNRNHRIWGLRKNNQETAAGGGWVGMDLKVLKNRHGATGSDDLSFCPFYSVFEEGFSEIAEQINEGNSADKKKRTRGRKKTTVNFYDGKNENESEGDDETDDVDE